MISALYFPYDGPYAGRGKRRKYGTKLDYRHLPAAYLQSSSLEDGMQTKIYQMKVWHKTCADFAQRGGDGQNQCENASHGACRLIQ